MIIYKDGIAMLGGEDVLSQRVADQGLKCDAMANQTIVPLLKPGMWVLDGGAALGDHTKAYMDAVGPEGVVIAFEPNPEYFQCLMHNCKGSLNINAGLSSTSRNFFLHYMQANVGGAFLSAEASKLSGDDEIYEVRVVRIDSLNLPKLDLLKLDLEGWEYEALRGATETVARCRPMLLLELRDLMLVRAGATVDMLYDLIEGWGYRHEVACGELGHRSRNCDILATPK